MTSNDSLSKLPDWVDQIVVFDTNAYRELAGGGDIETAFRRVEELRGEERRAGIQPLASPTVLMELIAHLADPADPSYRPAKAALTAAGVHCMMSEGGSSHVAIAPSPDLQLCHTLWGRWPDDLQKMDNTIRGVAQAVADGPSDENLETFREDLMLSAEAVDRAEQAFAMSMRQHLIKNLRAELDEATKGATRKEVLDAFRKYLDSDRARRMVAEAHVRRAMSHLGDITDSDEEIGRKGERIERWFSVAIELYVRIVRKIAESNWDLTAGKGGNYLWDLQVAFLVGKEHEIQGRRTLVVSADKEIIAAAADAGVTDVVQPYEDYRGTLVAT